MIGESDLVVNVQYQSMNFFSNDLVKGVTNMMSNNGWGGGNQKQNLLRSNLERCTYPDETKWMIEKATKQLFHVYPFFNPDILMFNQNGQPRRYIELKGILEIDIKGKICKVDFNMMLPSDYPRSPPFVRIVNRNPDYIVDSFYQSLKSKTDPTSYILNEKLTSVKNWMPSSSLVNVVIECYDTFKGRFPFSKPVAENNFGGGNNAWDALYNSKKTNNNGGNNWGGNNNNTNGSWGTQPNNNNNWGTQPSNPNTWGNNNNWGSNNNNNTGWGNNNNNWANNNNNNSWGTNNNNSWGTSNNNNWSNPNPPNNNTWGNNNNNSWGTGAIGGMGGMGGIIGGGVNVTSTIASAQKLTAKQKQSLAQMNVHYIKAIQKIQLLDITKQSLESQENYLRKENYEMGSFLKANQMSEITSVASIVQPKDALSQQMLDLMSGIKARQECALLLQAKFNQEEMSLQQFLKHLRKVEEAKFQEKFILYKCLQKSK